jgi:hypothetical protein
MGESINDSTAASEYAPAISLMLGILDFGIAWHSHGVASWFMGEARWPFNPGRKEGKSLEQWEIPRHNEEYIR